MAKILHYKYYTPTEIVEKCINKLALQYNLLYYKLNKQ